jgi:hypoxanthine phosphoribosyltransferase
MTEISYLHLKWDDVHCLAEKVADKIIHSGFVPDIIVAVSRGGFDLSRILCDELDVRELASFQIAYYTNINEKSGIPRATNPLNADIKCLKVLLVDDVSDSGESLIYAKKYVEQLYPSEIKIATLHYKPWSKLEPDFFADIVNDWILYPWETRESILQISQGLIEKGYNVQLIREELLKIGYKKDHIKRHLNFKTN